MQKPFVIGHRGDSSRALENSLESFQFALSVPVDMIEFDLRMSEDQVLYAMHDRFTGRTADRDIEIERAHSSEIEKIRLRNDEPIPALADIFRLVKGKARLNIEIKSDGAGEVLAGRLLQSRYPGAVVVSSFKEPEILAVRKAVRNLPVAAVYDTFSIRHIGEYKEKGYDLISLRKNTVTEQLVRACHAAGIKIYVWTVNHEDEMRRCIEWKVDGIYTDKPSVLRAMIDKSPGKSIKK